jgi:hypothetical protein
VRLLGGRARPCAWLERLPALRTHILASALKP